MGWNANDYRDSGTSYTTFPPAVILSFFIRWTAGLGESFPVTLTVGTNGELHRDFPIRHNAGFAHSHTLAAGRSAAGDTGTSRRRGAKATEQPFSAAGHEITPSRLFRLRLDSTAKSNRASSARTNDGRFWKYTPLSASL